MRELIQKFTGWWRLHYVAGIAYTAVIVPMILAGIAISQSERATGERHLKELRKVVDELPLYPGSEKIREWSSAKPSSSLVITYRAYAQQDELVRFYDQALTQSGWKLLPVKPSWTGTSPDPFTYRRGLQQVTIKKQPNSDTYDLIFLRDDF